MSTIECDGPGSGPSNEDRGPRGRGKRDQCPEDCRHGRGLSKKFKSTESGHDRHARSVESLERSQTKRKTYCSTSLSHSTEDSGKSSSGKQDTRRTPDFYIITQPKGQHTLDLQVAIHQFSSGTPLLCTFRDQNEYLGREVYKMFGISDSQLETVTKSKSFKEVKQVLNVCLSGLKYEDGLWEESATDTTFLETVADSSFYENARCIRAGLLEGLDKGTGRGALTSIFELCKEVVKQEMPVAYSTRDMVVSNWGTNSTIKRLLHGIDYFIYNDRDHDVYKNRQNVDETLALLDTLSSDAATHGVHCTTTNPDVIMFYCDAFDYTRADKLHYLLVGEIASDADKTTNAGRTWRQALVGLKTRNISYGVLFEIDKIHIYQLHKIQTREQNFAKLETSHAVWSLLPYRQPLEPSLFKVDQLLDLIKTVICIIASFKPS